MTAGGARGMAANIFIALSGNGFLVIIGALIEA